MKRVFFITFTSFYLLFAQQDTISSRVPEIELPDFVITGQAQVDVPAQEKSIPDLINPLSPEFILPRIGIEELKLEGLTDPTKLQPSIVDTSRKYFARAQFLIGLYSLPKANLFYSGKLKSVNFNLSGNFENIRDFEKYSRTSLIDLSASSAIIIEKTNEPPARLKIKSDFTRFGYYIFKAVKPDSFGKETNTNIKITTDLENLFWREFNLSLGGNIEYHQLGRSGFSFFALLPYATLKSTFEHFELTTNVFPKLYKRATWKTFNNLILAANGEMYLRRLLKIMNIILRMDYQSEREDNKQFLAPSAQVGFSLSDYWSLSLFYSNQLINYTPMHLWSLNPYLDTTSYDYSIERIKNRFGFGTTIYFDQLSNLKFEFSRYDVSGKNVFVHKSSKIGFFDIEKHEVEVLDINTSLFLELKRLGNIFLNLNYVNSRIKQTTRYTPHTPSLQIKSIYTYKFETPLYLRLSFLYNSIRYVDKENLESIAPTLDLGIGAGYVISEVIDLEIDFNNLLNKKNERWYKYINKPIDFELKLKAKF